MLFNRQDHRYNHKMTIASQLIEIKQRITTCEIKYGRDSGSVALLLASKKQSSEHIRAAWQAGQHAFGENYLQEALLKMAELPLPDIEWHFIGPIQSNKTRKIAEHFAWVQSIASLSIAKRLHEQRPLHLPPLNICLEINVNAEPSKSGIAPDEVQALADACRAYPRLKLRGLMTIPEPAETQNAARQNFHVMYELWQQLRKAGHELDTLSMGMSDDFEAAIAEGSTLVRIGTAVFGARS
jgi:pyridoxal phosphate enzyme (YggS family)